MNKFLTPQEIAVTLKQKVNDFTSFEIIGGPSPIAIKPTPLWENDDNRLNQIRFSIKKNGGDKRIRLKKSFPFNITYHRDGTISLVLSKEKGIYFFFNYQGNPNIIPSPENFGTGLIFYNQDIENYWEKIRSDLTILSYKE